MKTIKIVKELESLHGDATIMLEIYTPTQDTGACVVINGVELFIDEIGQLFNILEDMNNGI